MIRFQSCLALSGALLVLSACLAPDSQEPETGAALQNIGDCSECDGKATRLTLLFDSQEAAHIRLEQKKNNVVVFDGQVDAGGMFSFEGADDRGTLNTEITLFVDGVEVQRIHTSCSRPIDVGLVFGDFEVVDGASRNGGPFCTDEEPPEEVCDDGIDNEGDGLIDCADPDCVIAPACETPIEVTLEKRVNTTTANVGEQILYDIVIFNSGDVPITDLNIVDVLPGLVDFDGFSGAFAPSYDAPTHTVTWSVGALAPGDLVIVDVLARVQAPGVDDTPELRNTGMVYEGDHLLGVTNEVVTTINIAP